MSPEPIWSRRIADELWSGVVTPLTFTMLADLMAEHMVRRRLGNAGLGELAGQPVFRLARGHVYVNASLIAEVMAEVPAVFLSEGLLALLPDELGDRVRRKARSLLSPALASIVVNLGLKERGWMPWSRGDLFRRAAERAAGDLRVLAVASDASGPVIASRMVEVRAQLARYLEAVSWGMIYAYVFFHLTAQLLERWAPETSSIAALTVGVEGIWTFAIHDDLVACAAVARGDARLGVALTGDPARVAERCMNGELGELGVRIRELLARHGHRLVGRDLSYPSWRERPSVVIEMLQKLLEADSPLSVDERRLGRDEILRQVTARISGGLGGSLRQLVFERSLAWCKEYYVLRENMRYHADLFLSALRTLALSAAEQLVASGALHEPEDVFYLEASELHDALSGAVPAPASLAVRAAGRRADYALFGRGEAPERLIGGEDCLASAAAERGAATTTPPRALSLCGLGVSPGRATGRARVVHSVEDLKSLRVGEVIVAASTDPSWTSLLAVGGALVLEMGGLLSHGAIVARELGIPAVVNVQQATRLLATGERIIVDGRAGTVARA